MANNVSDQDKKKAEAKVTAAILGTGWGVFAYLGGVYAQSIGWDNAFVTIAVYANIIIGIAFGLIGGIYG
ncbi:MAG: hypothetical protein M0T84_05220 [Betaproteobacteria bacterium]|nr:hypothetical protein [Betaproteobacteria bacterium]